MTSGKPLPARAARALPAVSRMALVVDDSRMQRRILSTMLAKWGYRVREAGDAGPAIARFRRWVEAQRTRRREEATAEAMAEWRGAGPFERFLGPISAYPDWLGHYLAGWTVPEDEPLGAHEIRWFFKLTSGSTEFKY